MHETASLPLLPGELGPACPTLERTEVFERLEFPALRSEPPQDYRGWTKAQLYERARALGIAGRSSLTKAGLIAAIRRAA